MDILKMLGRGIGVYPLNTDLEDGVLMTMVEQCSLSLANFPTSLEEDIHILSARFVI